MNDPVHVSLSGTTVEFKELAFVSSFLSYRKLRLLYDKKALRGSQGLPQRSEGIAAAWKMLLTQHAAGGESRGAGFYFVQRRMRKLAAIRLRFAQTDGEEVFPA